MDGPDVAGRIFEEYKATPNDMKPDAICIDVIGVGYSVYDTLKRNPTLMADGVRVVGVNVSETESHDGANSRLRDALWWALREWFTSLKAHIPYDFNQTSDEQKLIDALVAELATPTYGFTDSGKRAVISKRLMKADLGYSPDLADGLMLTFAVVETPRETEQFRRWADDSDDNTDPWSA